MSTHGPSELRITSELGANEPSETTEKSPFDAAKADATSIRVLETGPTGTTLDPFGVATIQGRTAYHANLTVEAARRLVTALEEGNLPTEDAHAVVEHDPETADLPTPDEGPLAVGERRVLARCGWVEPASAAESAIAAESATSAARDAPDATLETIAELGVLGRGRGDGATDSPIADEWTTVREADGDPVVVVNANDADVQTADRLLCESVPGEVLDGALAVAAAVGAAEVVVSVGEADERAQERLQDAIRAIEAPSVQLAVAPNSFIAGETTMALEALEGNDRLEARRRPPGPSEYGLHGRPTVVHTPRTLAQVREVVRDSQDGAASRTGRAGRAGRAAGGSADPGTRLVTVAGDVADSATVELPTDGSLETALDAVEHPPAKLFCVGGRFGGLARSLQVPPSAPGLSAARLGTNGSVEVFDESNCAVAIAGKRARFAREENCGRCVPCREGSVQLHEQLREIYDGRFDDDGLRELGRVMETTSLCSFGRAAARPATTAIDEFEAEFRAHADGRCPAGVCTGGSS